MKDAFSLYVGYSPFVVFAVDCHSMAVFICRIATFFVFIEKNIRNNLADIQKVRTFASAFAKNLEVPRKMTARAHKLVL